MGARVARARGGGVRRLGAHPRGARGRRRPRRPRATRFRRASTSTSSGRCRARRRSRGCSRRRGAIRRIPATRTSGCRTRATPSGSRSSSREPGPTVVYFGKLIYNKGVHLLLEALDGLDAKAVIVGFGDYREELEALAPARTLFTGALEHRHLAALLPLCDVAVVPSIFPEAFGMVAAEAAAAGVPPIVARHSGLAEVAEGIEAEYPPERAPLDDVHERRRRGAARQARRAARPARGGARATRRARRAGRSSSAGAGRAWRNAFSRQ